MVVVPMRVKRWNWNEVKSEELAGLSVALVGPSPWDPNELQAQMPGDAIVTEPAETDIHLLYCLPSHHAQGINTRVDAMATRTPRLRFFARAKPSQSISGCAPARRQFATSATRSTDGVFRALTENRVRTPWIEALTKKQQEGKDPSRASGIPETPSDRDLSPRSMSDSYHSVVCSG